jgi:hypothetical protein
MNKSPSYILKHVFGYDEFRGEQEAIINNVSNDDKKTLEELGYLTDPCLTTTKTQFTLTSQVSTAWP